MVRLLRTVKIPCGHQKVVQTSISGGLESSLLLFSPSVEQPYLLLPDAAIVGADGSCANLVIENHGIETIRLKRGTLLGTVVPVEQVELEDCPEVGEVCGLGSGSTCTWRAAEPVGDVLAMRADADRAVIGGDGRKGVYPVDTATVGTLAAVDHSETASVCVAEQGSDPGCRPEVSSSEDWERTRRLLEQLSLQVDHLNPSQRDQLTRLIVTFSDVFALDASELGTTTFVTHTIHTGDHTPMRQPVRRMPFALRAEVDKMVGDMLDQGVIQPSSSPWASPVVLVRKKDGGMRFCVDYRKLNHVTKLDEFPLPRIDDTLDLLAGARYFTTLDLASGYWQVAMDPSSQEKTAFTTYSGLYEFCKMPFGLVNAPATFQRLMERVLAGLARGGCHVYLDDVLVFGKTMEEHNQNLTEVLGRIRGAGLRLKPRKCNFAQESVEYLGHVVSAQGIQTDLRKLAAVNQYTVPTDVKSLRSFLGLASYYRRFVPRFSQVAAPLHALTRKEIPYFWTPECQQVFEKLKELLTSAPLLKYPDFSKPFVLETDASGVGLGAVLAQRQEDGTVQPIAYASRSLQKHERNYGITELEGLGVVWAAKHFRPYLYGHECTVYTDHEALKSLLNTPQPSGKLARWGLALQELNLTILHRSGKHNTNADALSRSPLPSSGADESTGGVVAALAGGGKEGAPPADDRDLSLLQRADPELAPVITYLETGRLPEEEKPARQIALTSMQYTLEDDVLYRVEDDGTLRIIPPTDWRERLFMEAHGGKFGAHLSDAKVFSQLRRHYWWGRMRQDITQWTRGCIVCATRSVGRAVRAPLTPIPVAGPFDQIGVDIIQFPKTSRGNQYAVVFMDYLTKWPEVFAVPDQSAATVARLLVEELVSRHGVPSEVLSDRGRAFLSSLMQEVELLLGFRKTNTTAYHPQTDGLVERFNCTLTAMLAKTVEKRGVEWDTKLPYVLFAYRACQQSSTRESPFYLLYGRDPRLPTPNVLTPKVTRATADLNEYGVGLHARMSEAWELAQSQITRAQKSQKNAYDRSTKKSPFRAGERVFLYKPAERTGGRRKFARPFHGPYRLVEVDTNTAKIRPVDKPQDEPILVALDRLRRCPDEIGEEFWPPSAKKSKKKSTKHRDAEDASNVLQEELELDQPMLLARAEERDTTQLPSAHLTGLGTANVLADAQDEDIIASGATEDQRGGCTQVTGGGTGVGKNRRATQPTTGRASGATQAKPSNEDTRRTLQDLGGAQDTMPGEREFSCEGGPEVAGSGPLVEEQELQPRYQPTQRTKKRASPVDTAPTKWAGRLRSKRGLPRTATQQQGEM